MTAPRTLLHSSSVHFLAKHSDEKCSCCGKRLRKNVAKQAKRHLCRWLHTQPEIKKTIINKKIHTEPQFHTRPKTHIIPAFDEVEVNEGGDGEYPVLVLTPVKVKNEMKKDEMKFEKVRDEMKCEKEKFEMQKDEMQFEKMKSEMKFEEDEIDPSLSRMKQVMFPELEAARKLEAAIDEAFEYILVHAEKEKWLLRKTKFDFDHERFVLEKYDGTQDYILLPAWKSDCCLASCWRLSSDQKLRVGFCISKSTSKRLQTNSMSSARQLSGDSIFSPGD